MTTVYKYLPPERISFLHDSLLRFTQPGALNDPFEVLPGLADEVIQAAFEYIGRELLMAPAHPPGMTRNERRAANREYKKRAAAEIRGLDVSRFRERVFERGIKNINEKLGILSLSRRWDSSLMWSHYCASHTGYCVGLEREHNFFKREGDVQEFDFMLLPVTYSHERPRIPARHMNPEDALRMLLTKSSDWKYEEEERVVSLLSAAVRTIPMDPYAIALFEIPREAITEVTIGLRASAGLRDCAAAIAKSLAIPLYVATLSDSTFDMNRELA